MGLLMAASQAASTVLDLSIRMDTALHFFVGRECSVSYSGDSLFFIILKFGQSCCLVSDQNSFLTALSLMYSFLAGRKCLQWMEALHWMGYPHWMGHFPQESCNHHSLLLPECFLCLWAVAFLGSNSVLRSFCSSCFGFLSLMLMGSLQLFSEPVWCWVRCWCFCRISMKAFDALAGKSLGKTQLLGCVWFTLCLHHYQPIGITSDFDGR